MTSLRRSAREAQVRRYIAFRSSTHPFSLAICNKAAEA
jgi:hypothetical protein